MGLGIAVLSAAVLGSLVFLSSDPSPAYSYPAAGTEKEAREVLDGLVGQAAAEDWEGICGTRGSEGLGCDPVGGGSVLAEYRAIRPVLPPAVLGGRPVGDEACGHLPRFVLELEGYDARGNLYRSDLYVARSFDGRLFVSMPV